MGVCGTVKNSREFNRILEIDLIRNKLINLNQAHLDLTMWLDQNQMWSKVDQTLVQFILDLKELQLDFGATMVNYIKREHEQIKGGVK